MTEKKITDIYWEKYVANITMNYLLFIESKINQPHVLSAPDRDTGVNEAREYRDDIENYDEPRDCLPNLSDVALTFYLPET